jgi:hypothetical protein
MSKIIYYTRAILACPFVAMAWIGFGLAMIIEPKGPKP